MSTSNAPDASHAPIEENSSNQTHTSQTTMTSPPAPSFSIQVQLQLLYSDSASSSGTNTLPLANLPFNNTANFPFNSLPAEIRREIIRLACEPQEIYLDFSVPAGVIEEQFPIVLRTTPTPITLRINKEWKQEALRFYTVLEISVDEYPYRRIAPIPRIYINFETDTLVTGPIEPFNGKDRRWERAVFFFMDGISGKQVNQLSIIFEDMKELDLQSILGFSTGLCTGLLWEFCQVFRQFTFEIREDAPTERFDDIIREWGRRNSTAYTKKEI